MELRMCKVLSDMEFSQKQWLTVYYSYYKNSEGYLAAL